MKSSEPAPCLTECPVRRTADILEGKWTTLILRDLLAGKQRFSTLQRSLAGISPRLLTARLRALERHGVVRRHAFATVPVTTEYELTPLGQRLRPVVAAMAEFGEVLAN